MFFLLLKSCKNRDDSFPYEREEVICLSLNEIFIAGLVFALIQIV